MHVNFLISWIFFSCSKIVKIFWRNCNQRQKFFNVFANFANNLDPHFKSQSIQSKFRSRYNKSVACIRIGIYWNSQGIAKQQGNPPLCNINSFQSRANKFIIMLVIIDININNIYYFIYYLHLLLSLFSWGSPKSLSPGCNYLTILFFYFHPNAQLTIINIF